MSKNSIDYDSLNYRLKKTRFKLEDVKNRIEKVAFDVVRFRDRDDKANLWKVQDSDDGQYIVALFEDDNESLKKTSNWEVKISEINDTINFFYKNDPIVTIATSKLGLKKESISNYIDILPFRLDNNKKLVNSLLKEMPINVRNSIISKYPELA